MLRRTLLLLFLLSTPALADSTSDRLEYLRCKQREREQSVREQRASWERPHYPYTVTEMWRFPDGVYRSAQVTRQSGDARVLSVDGRDPLYPR